MLPPKRGLIIVRFSAGIFAVAAGVWAAFLFYPAAVWATTYIVNSPDDTNDGTCTNPFVNAANDCTMREAINAANGHAGADTILIAIDASFASDGSGQWTTTVTSAYSTVTSPVTIDASGMWDSTHNRPGFRLYSTSTSLAGLSLNFAAAGSKIKGLEIEGYNAGINIGAGANSIVVGTDCDGTNDSIERNVLHKASNQEIRILASSVVVAGNYIGVDDDGLTVGSSPLYGVWISGASADNNSIGFREGQTCTAAQQRNVISGTGPLTGDGIRIEGTGTANTAGDSSLGPNGNSIAGNYIGLDATGTTAVTNYGNGIDVLTNSTLNWIGTDGDGVSDASEANIVSGNGTGILVANTGVNRLAGNTIGLNAAGTAAVPNTLSGVNVRGTGNIIGWCDANVNSTLCSNSGVLANQHNIVSGNTTDGIRLGYQAYTTLVYGNYVGVAADGTTSFGNSENGIFVHRGDTGNLIGGPSVNQTNLIQANGVGVKLDGDFIGAGSRGSAATQVAVSGNTIQNNTIQQNVVGVLNQLTENYSTAGPTDNTITANAINNNTRYGIDVYGSSPAITSNTINNNSLQGIYVHPAFITYSSTNEITTTSGDDPVNAASNLISRPIITGNTISGNSTGGIYLYDSRPNNYTTLESDNTIGNNNGVFDIQQDWLGAVEVLDRSGVPIPASALAGTTVTLTPSAAGISSSTFSASDTQAASGLTQNVFGPSGIDYNQATTWKAVTEYSVNFAGTQTNYGPYTATTSGTYTSSTGNTYTFDGIDNDTAYTNTLPNGITTDGQSRYQISKVLASTVPSTPTTVSPSNGSTTLNLTPTLTSSTYADASSDPQYSTTWRVYITSAACSAGGTGDVINSTSTDTLSAYPIASGVLSENTAYYWSVAYTNSFGNRSAFSSCASFTTIQTTPSFSGTIPTQTVIEDQTTSAAFDLDSFFSDAEAEALTFSTSVTPTHVTVSIDVNGTVAFTPEANYSGSENATFKACDTDNQCVTSNSVTIHVSSVNDTPSPPTANFSPCCSSTTTDQTPEISWTAATDVDNSESELHYELRLDTSADPVSNATLTQTSDVGVNSVQIRTQLNDETTYYYAVRTIDSSSATSDWSSVQQFYVNTALLPIISLTKQTAVDNTSWLQKLYHWILNVADFLPGLLPTQASDGVTIDPDIAGTSPHQLTTSGTMVVSSITPLGAIAVVIETLIGIFVLTFVVSFFILLRQSHKPKQILSLLFGNPASSFFQLFMGNNITIEAISYAHFKAKLQFIRVVLTAAMISVAALLVVHQLFSPQSPLAAKLASEIASGSVEPSQSITVTLTYQNTGDGDASSAVFTDTLPSGTSLVAGSASVNGVSTSDAHFLSGSRAYVQLGTVTAGSTGTIRYAIQVDNPYTDLRLSLPAASITANELTSTTYSNGVVLSVNAGELAGTVIDATTGDGLSNVLLRLSQDGTQLMHTSTNGHGAYAFTGLATGKYKVSVETPTGYDEVADRSYSVTAGETLNVDIEFTPTATGGSEPPDETPVETPDETPVEVPDETPVETPVETPDETPIEPIKTPVVEPTTPDDTTPPPDEVVDDLPETPDLTDEQDSLKDDLQNALSLDSVNNIGVSTGVIGVVGANSLAGLPSQLAQDLDKILLPADTQEVVLVGHGLPNSQVVITICSEATVQVVQTDDTGTWRMVVPRKLFDEGEHVATASGQKDGVSSDQIEIARFVVLDDLAITSKPALIIGLNVLLLVLFVNLVLWGARRGKAKQMDPLLPEVMLSGAEKGQQRRRFATSFILYSLAILAFVTVFFIPHPRLFDAKATRPADTKKIELTEVNQHSLAAGTAAAFHYISQLHLKGTAPADTEIALTLCPGVTFRTTASGPNGEWSLDIPAIVLPKGQFSLQAQFSVDGQLGKPHTIAEFTLNSIQILPRDYTLYGITVFMVMLSMSVLWRGARRPVEALPPGSDLAPPDIAGAD